MKKLVVLAFHGIGTYYDPPNQDFDRKLREGIRKRLGMQFDELIWKRVLWSDEALERHQADLIRRRDPPAVWARLFNFVAGNLCDATAYMLPQIKPGFYGSSYFTIQSHVLKALEQVEADFPQVSNGFPVFAFADSMGCRVLSGYAWDSAINPEWVRNPDANPAPLTPFERLEGLAGLVFTGCNIPLLTMDIDNKSMMPIKLPMHPVSAKPGFRSAWVNMYDRDDVLGYPITQEFRAYFSGGHTHERLFHTWNRDPNAETPPQDVVVRVKHILGFTPYAHVQYWNSGVVLDRGAAELKRLLAVL